MTYNHYENVGKHFGHSSYAMKSKSEVIRPLFIEKFLRLNSRHPAVGEISKKYWKIDFN